MCWPWPDCSLPAPRYAGFTAEMVAGSAGRQGLGGASVVARVPATLQRKTNLAKPRPKAVLTGLVGWGLIFALQWIRHEPWPSRDDIWRSGIEYGH